MSKLQCPKCGGVFIKGFDMRVCLCNPPYVGAPEDPNEKAGEPAEEIGATMEKLNDDDGLSGVAEQDPRAPNRALFPPVPNRS